MDLVVSTLGEAPQRHGANSVQCIHEARLDCVNSPEQLLHAQSTCMAQLHGDCRRSQEIPGTMGNTGGGSVDWKPLVSSD